MALKNRIARLEKTLGSNALVTVTGEDGQLVYCEHGQPYRIPKGGPLLTLREGLVINRKRYAFGLPNCHCPKDAPLAMDEELFQKWTPVDKGSKMK